MEKHGIILRMPIELFKLIKKESEQQGVSVHELILKTLNDKFRA